MCMVDFAVVTIINLFVPVGAFTAVIVVNVGGAAVNVAVVVAVAYGQLNLSFFHLPMEK